MAFSSISGWRGSVEPDASSASYSCSATPPVGALEYHQDRPRRQAAADRFDERREVAVEEDDLRRRVLEDVPDLVRRQPDVDRIQHGARLDDAVVRLQQVVGVER